MMANVCVYGRYTGTSRDDSGGGGVVQQDKPWLPMWLKITLAVILLILVCLIVSNMEPAYTAPAIDSDV